MSTQPTNESKKPKKPPACDAYKAKRVMCYSQPNGEACPRCVEKNIICITTPVPRGRPRKHRLDPPSSTSFDMTLVNNAGPVLQTSGNCPELTAEFVAHCFDGEQSASNFFRNDLMRHLAIQYMPQLNHPLIESAGIKTKAGSSSYQLHLLPPQSRVLALSIICAASLASYHPLVLGDSPRPQSFLDNEFFSVSSSAVILGCGVRRAAVYNALRDEALKAAWEAGVMLQPSEENAASCYLLDLLEQSEFSGSSRPWATAYLSHVRVLAPHWHSSGYTATDAATWAGFLMGEALLSTRNRTPLLFTTTDQLMLSGPEPETLEGMLISLEKSSANPSYSLLWSIMRPFLYHISTLARELSETIAGDYPRLAPLSEAAVIKIVSQLSLMQAIMAIVLERVDVVLQRADNSRAAVILDGSSVDSAARQASYGAIFGFIGLVLPFYRELEFREVTEGPGSGSLRNEQGNVRSERTSQRMTVLRAQARDMAVSGAGTLARGIRWLPRIRYTPTHWSTIYAWAEFVAEEADRAQELSEKSVEDIETFVQELVLLGYSLDAAARPQAIALLHRLQSHINRARGTAGGDAAESTLDSDLDLFKPAAGSSLDLDLDLLQMFPPLEDWMAAI